jgi:methylenetetrahydrofolate reductase (NADPH)
VLTRPLLERCLKEGQSPDGGKGFFYEFAAKQMAIYRGLGYRGAYLGGAYDFPAIERILEIERSFAPGDWKQFAEEIKFSQPGEFFYDAKNAAPPAKRASAVYFLSKWTHDIMFSPGRLLTRWGASLCRKAKNPMQGPKPMRALEHVSKSILFRCHDCGDCSLPEIAFLCPESQCAKNQRNGPCGGTRGGHCEVDGYGDCIWLRAYERLKQDGKEQTMLDFPTVTQNQGLRGTSAWANYWLGRDHVTRPKAKTK